MYQQTRLFQVVLYLKGARKTIRRRGWTPRRGGIRTASLAETVAAAHASGLLVDGLEEGSTALALALVRAAVPVEALVEDGVDVELG